MGYLSKIIIRDLKLLGFDFNAHCLPSDPESFGAYFKLPRKKEFLSLLRFLLQVIDSSKYEEIMKQSASDVVLKNAFHKWLASLGSRLQLPVTLFRVWGMPAGLTLLQFLAPISIFALESAYNVTGGLQCPSLTDFQSHLGELKKNDEIQMWYTSNLITFEDRLQKFRNVSESQLSSTVEDVRHFVEKQSQTELLRIMNEKENLVQLPDAFQTSLQKLLDEVNARRHILRSPCEKYASKLQELHTLFSSMKTGISILDGQRFTISHTPTWIVNQLGRNKLSPIRERDQINLRTLIQSIGALFAISCKVLRVSTSSVLGSEMQSTGVDKSDLTNTDEFQSEPRGDLCLRIFQRTVHLLGDANHSIDPPQTAMYSELNSELTQLIVQMNTSIRSLQPTIALLEPPKNSLERKGGKSAVSFLLSCCYLTKLL